MFLLDTNVISELRKIQKRQGDKNVTKWAMHADVSAFFLSAITLMELEIGVSLLERKDDTQGTMLRAWLQKAVRPTFEGHVLPVDEEVALCCAKLHIPNPASDRDALIGATALVHGMTVVTRNISDFQHFKVRIFNPWEVN